MQLKQLGILLVTTALSASALAVTQNTLVTNSPSGLTYVPELAPEPVPEPVRHDEAIPLGALAAAGVAAIASAPLGGVAGAAILGGAVGSVIRASWTPPPATAQPSGPKAPTAVSEIRPVAAPAQVSAAPLRAPAEPVASASGANAPMTGAVFTQEAFDAMRKEKARLAGVPAQAAAFAPMSNPAVAGQAQPARLRSMLDSKPAPARVGPNKKPLAVVGGD